MSLLARPSRQSVRQATGLIRDLQLVETTDQLLELASAKAPFLELRVEMLDALAVLGTDRAVDALATVIADAKMKIISSGTAVCCRNCCGATAGSGARGGAGANRGRDHRPTERLLVREEPDLGTGGPGAVHLIRD